MNKDVPFLPGLTTLLRGHADWLKGKRIALLSHQAAVDGQGVTSAERLWTDERVKLAAILGPEHGFYGVGGAGETMRSGRHRRYNIPVYSLYGKTRRPAPRMLRRVDAIVVDLQDLGARPYTYVSTLKEVMIAADRLHIPVIVADRPIPLAHAPDGPITQEGYESFVAAIAAPMLYAMTMGETALWLREQLALDVDVRVSRMQGYHRDPARRSNWPPWVPPSPAIVSWESAQCYTATVFTEAIPAIDCGRNTGLSFQLIGAPRLRAAELIERLGESPCPGVSFHEHTYVARTGPHSSKVLDGVRIAIRSPARFRPVSLSVAIVAALQDMLGVDRLWRSPKARLKFFDTLYGTPSVRLALMEGVSGHDVASSWQKKIARYKRSRREHLLYS